mgnify:CR=1 FL=1
MSAAPPVLFLRTLSALFALCALLSLYAAAQSSIAYVRSRHVPVEVRSSQLTIDAAGGVNR